jgi:hypothetical protein
LSKHARSRRKKQRLSQKDVSFPISSISTHNPQRLFLLPRQREKVKKKENLRLVISLL